MNVSTATGSARSEDVSRILYRTLGTSFMVESPEDEVARAVLFQYAHLRSSEGEPEAKGDLHVEIRPLDAGGSYAVRVAERTPFRADGTSHLLHELDNELSIALQRAVPDLYFVHAACLARDGESATMIVGDSGAGKSTTTFALCREGLRYLSDELSAIDLSSGRVLPYPRAICLKNDPPPPLRLPSTFLRGEWTLHIHADEIGSEVTPETARLDRIVFLTVDAGREEAALRPVSSGEAALRLYRGALNQLAHSAWGLDDTLRLVSGAQCYELRRGGVEDTLRALKQAEAL